jgi:hypothetical protein
MNKELEQASDGTNLQDAANHYAECCNGGSRGSGIIQQCFIAGANYANQQKGIDKETIIKILSLASMKVKTVGTWVNGVIEDDFEDVAKQILAELPVIETKQG